MGGDGGGGGGEGQGTFGVSGGEGGDRGGSGGSGTGGVGGGDGCCASASAIATRPPPPPDDSQEQQSDKVTVKSRVCVARCTNFTLALVHDAHADKPPRWRTPTPRTQTGRASRFRGRRPAGGPGFCLAVRKPYPPTHVGIGGPVCSPDTARSLRTHATGRATPSHKNLNGSPCTSHRGYLG